MCVDSIFLNRRADSSEAGVARIRVVRGMLPDDGGPHMFYPLRSTPTRCADDGLRGYLALYGAEPKALVERRATPHLTLSPSRKFFVFHTFLSKPA